MATPTPTDELGEEPDDEHGSTRAPRVPKGQCATGGARPARVDAQGVFPTPKLNELPPATTLDDARRGTRTVVLESGAKDATIYARERLGAGARLEGLAIVTQLDATTLILDGQAGVVDRFGNLIITEAC